MFGLGVGEIVVILVVALIFIGPKKLPELAKTLGKGFREFQNAMRGINQSIHNPDSQSDAPQSKVSWEEQFKDDPPHEQNLAEEDIALKESINSKSEATENEPLKNKKENE